MDKEYLNKITGDKPVKIMYETAEIWMMNYMEHCSKADIAQLYEMVQDKLGNKVVVEG
mgnify:FL=1